MGGYRARGALATLALATVVLVAVVAAGTFSMAPLSDDWTGQIPQPEDRNSFEVVGGVIVPGDPSEPSTPPGQPPGSGPSGNEEGEGDVIVVVGPEPAPDDGSGEPFLPPVGPIPPGPIDPPKPTDPPEPTDPTDPVDPPDPTDPPDPVDEPDPVDPTDPPIPPDRVGSGGPPRPRPGPVLRPDNGGKGGNGEPPVVIVRRGPKWRPAQPARQHHPQDESKWDGAQPHPRQRAKASPQRRQRDQAPALKHGTARGSADADAPRVRRGPSQRRPAVSAPSSQGSGNKGRWKRGNGNGGKKGKRGRR